MAKRKSKTTVFKAPKRAQTRAKQQKSAEENNLQSVEENQTSKSENNNSHNASCSDKLDEPQVEHSALQIIQTTEFPIDPGCSLDIKTSRDDNDDDDGNNTNPPEVSHENEHTAVITMQTPEPENSDKYILSKPINVETTNVDQPNTELDDEESENTSNSNHESQKIPDCHSELLELSSGECQTGIKLSHEDIIGSKMVEQLGSSDIIAQTKDDGSADPLVKRKKRKRMGMCRLGERKRMVKEQMTRGGQENKTGEVANEEILGKVNSNTSLEKESNTEMEVSEISSQNSCSVEDEQPDVQHGNEVQIFVECMSREEEITHKVNPTTVHHAKSDALERNKIECMDHSGHEENIREHPLLCAEMCTAEIGSMANVDLEEESTNVLAKEAVLIEAEASGSTSEVANYFEQHVSGEPSSPRGCDMTNVCISGQCEELMDFADNKTVMSDIEDMCESLDDALVSATVSAESKANCEERSTWSLSMPAAPPGGEDKDVQSVSERDAHRPADEEAPSSPLSIQSLTDSQLNNIPLSLEDFSTSETSGGLEDASELMSRLIRDLSSLNQIMMDAQRRIGFVHRGRIPSRPPRRSYYGPPYSGK